MKIYYLLMQWPVKSETFAYNDILAMQEDCKAEVRVAAMKRPQKNNYINANNIPSYQPQILLGIFLMIKHFLLSINLIIDILKYEKRLIHILKSIALFPSAFAIINDIRAEKPDIVHLFWGHYPSIVAFLLDKMGLGVKYTMFLGAYDLKMRYGLSKLVAKNAAMIFTHAAGNVPLIKDFIGNIDVKVIYRGINIPEKPNFRREIPEIIDFLFAGRIIESKGIYILPNIMKILRDRGINCRINIVGDGEDLQELKNKFALLGIADLAIFHGWKRQNELFAQMQRSHFLLFPSHMDILANVVKESMARGCLPFVLKDSYIAELIDDGINGFIVQKFCHVAFAEKIISALEMMQDDDLFQQIQRSAYEKISRDFSVNNNMIAYHQKFAEIVS